MLASVLKVNTKTQTIVFMGLSNINLDDQTYQQAVELCSDYSTVNLNFNEVLYKQYQFYHVFDICNQEPNFFDFILKQHIESEQQQNTITTLITYGQKSTGKSSILGTLFENHIQQYSLVYQTLQSVFINQFDETISEVYISCYEVFLETLTDLFDETNEEFTTENDVTWLKVNSLEQADQQFKIAFLNRKQIVDENGLSYSQSHLIVNIKITDTTSENNGKIFSFVDLVGFDANFTQKIMDGSSFNVNDVSQLQRGEDNVDDDQLQQIICDCNDNNLYSLRNLLIAIESESDSQIQQVLEETTLARVVFAKLLQSNNFFVLGTISGNQNSFNETLNTLEFCTKFQNAMYHQQQQQVSANNINKSMPYQESHILQTEEGGRFIGLPQELSAYLYCNNKQDSMSKFYNNNNSYIQNEVSPKPTVLKQRHKSSYIINNKSNVSISSNRMHQYLDRFLQKQSNCGNSEHLDAQFNSIKSRNLNFNKEAAIKIQQDFRLDSSSQMMRSSNLVQKVKNTNQNKIINIMKAPSERSTGFATNTQITHNRKYSQDFISQTNNNINQISSITQAKRNNQVQHTKFERTFSELNFNQNDTKVIDNKNNTKIFNLQLENFSKIVDNKSKYDSSFLSTFMLNGETPTNQACQQAINQLKQAKEVVANNTIQRSKSQLNVQQMKNANSTLPPKYKQQQVVPSKSEGTKQQNTGQQFILQVIRESLKTVEVQMKDFDKFFTKKASKNDGCFPCTNNQKLQEPSNFSDVFKRQRARFFDIDKVLKEVEQKEIRHQTLTSLRESQPSHRKNNQSVNVLQSSLQNPQIMHQSNQSLIDKRPDSANQIYATQKENMPQNQNNIEKMPYFQSLNHLTYQQHGQHQSVDNRFQQNRDQRAMNELLNMINNSVETKRIMTRTMINK